MRILAIDGGGVRGIIPAMILSEIEERTQKKSCELFDLIAGTSTGGICAGALSFPLPAVKIVELYEKESITVFPKVSYWEKPIEELKELEYPEYNSSGLEAVIKKYGGEMLYSDAATELLITSYEITTAQPWYFQRNIVRKDPTWKDLKMVDVILAATAAPTYFQPKNIRNYTYIDAGLCGVNNPTDCALHVAEGEFQTKECTVVSLGTGQCLDRMAPTGHWGERRWAPEILSLSMQGSVQFTHKRIKDHFKNSSNGKYFRLQPEISRDHDTLDDASSENIHYLKRVAKQFIKENNEEIDEICKVLCNEMSLCSLV